MRAVFTVELRPLHSGLRSAARSLETFKRRHGDKTDVTLGVNRREFERELKRATKPVRDLRKSFADPVTLTLQAEGAKAVTGVLAGVQAARERLDGKSATVGIDQRGGAATNAVIDSVRKNAERGATLTVDSRMARAELRGYDNTLKQYARSWGQRGIRTRVQADITRASANLRRLEALADSVSGDRRLVVDAEVERARGRLRALEETARSLGMQSPTVSVGLRGFAATQAQMLGLYGLADRLDGYNLSMRADVDRSLSDALPSVLGALEIQLARVRTIQTSVAAVSLPLMLTKYAAMPAVMSTAGVAVAGFAQTLGTGVAGAAGAATTALGLGGSAVFAYGQAVVRTVGFVAGLSDTMRLQRYAVDQAADAVEEAEGRLRAAARGTREYSTAQTELRLAQQDAAFQQRRYDALIAAMSPRLIRLRGSLQDAQVGFVRFGGEIANETAPAISHALATFSRFSGGFSRGAVSMTRDMSRVSNAIFDAASSGQELESITAVLSGVREAGVPALRSVGNAGLAFANVLQAIVPDALKVLGTMDRLTASARRWTGSAEGQSAISREWANMSATARRLLGVAGDLSAGLWGVSRAISATGVGNYILTGLETYAQRFRNIMRAGGDARREITEFGRNTKPALAAAGGVALEAGRQFLRMASAVQKVGMRNQETGEKSTVLVEILHALRRSLAPIADLLIHEFKTIGPLIPDLIENLSKYFRVFAQATPEMQFFLRTFNRLLGWFVDLPKPVQIATARTMAYVAAAKALGGGAVLSGIAAVGRMGTQIWAVNRATKALTGGQGLWAVSAGAREAGKSAATAGGKFGLLRGSLFKIGGLLAGGIGLAVLGGSLLYAYNKNEDFRRSVNELGGKLKTAFSGVGGQIEEKLLPALTRAADGASNVLDDVMDLDAPKPQGWEHAGKTAGVGFVSKVNAEIRADANNAAGEGSAAYELGYKSGQGIRKGLGTVFQSKDGAYQLKWNEILKLPSFGNREGAGGGSGPVALGEQAGRGFREAMRGVDWAKLAASVMRFGGLGEAVADKIGGQVGKVNWAKLWKPIFRLPKWDFAGSPVGKLVSGVRRHLGDKIGGVNWSKPWKNIFELPKWDFAGSPLGKLVSKVKTNLGNQIDKVDWKKMWQKVGKMPDWKWRGSPLQKLWEGLRGDSEKTKEKASSENRKLETNLKNIWGRIWDFAKPKWLDIAQAIIGGSQRGKEQGGKRQRELETNSKNIWQRILEAAKPKWLDIAQAMIAGSQKGKEGSGKAQRENETNTKNIWQRVKDAAPIWGEIGSIMVKKAWDAKRGVENGFQAIVGFINKVLSAVKLPTINIGGDSAPTGKGNTGANTAGGKMGSTGVADGGVYEAKGMTKLMATGGIVAQNADGGVSDGRMPRAVYGEGRPGEGPQKETYAVHGRKDQIPYGEAFANSVGMTMVPRRLLPHSTKEHYTEGEKHLTHHMSAGGVLQAWRKMGVPMHAYGVTSSNVSPSMWKVNQGIESEHNVDGTTYAGHGAQGNAMTSTDWLVSQSGWNTVAVGAAKEKGDAIVRTLESKFAGMIEYIIWNKMANYSGKGGGGWQPYTGGGGYAAPSSPDGWHQDHVHASVLPGGGTGGGYSSKGGGFGAAASSLWDTVGNALWDRLVQPKVDTLAGAVGGSSKGVFGDIGAKLVTSTADKVKDYIIGEAGSSDGVGTGKYTGGGQLDDWLAEGLKVGGAFPVNDSNVAKLHSLAMEESTGNPNAVNEGYTAGGGHPSGLLQMLPDTFRAHMVPGHGDIFDPVDNTASSTRYQKDRYGYLKSHAPYARGGVHKPELKMPAPVAGAFRVVADALNRMVGGKENGSLRRETGRGQVTDGVTAIAGEAGKESIVPLERKTPEGDHALRTAMRVHYPRVRMFASGGVTTTGYNLVGSDGQMGIGGPAASDAISAISKYWPGTNVGRGSDVNAYYSSSRGGLTTSGGDMRVYSGLRGTALGELLWGHEGGHGFGLDHGPGLMGVPVSIGDRATPEQLAWARKLAGAEPSKPHGEGLSGTGKPSGSGSRSGSGGSTHTNSIRMTGKGSASYYSSQGGSSQSGSSGQSPSGRMPSSAGGGAPSAAASGKAGGKAETSDADAQAILRRIFETLQRDLPNLRELPGMDERTGRAVKANVADGLANETDWQRYLGRGMDAVGGRRSRGGPAISRAR